MTSDGIRYSNIEPDHESSTGRTTCRRSRRPRLNQCETGTSPLAIATQAREPRLRGEQVVVAGVELRILDAIADREQPPRRVEQEAEFHLRDEALRRAAPHAVSLACSTHGERGENRAAAARSAVDSAGRSGIVSSPASSAMLASSASVHAAGPSTPSCGVAAWLSAPGSQVSASLSSERESRTKRSTAPRELAALLAVPERSKTVREARGASFRALQGMVSVECIADGPRQLVMHLVDGEAAAARAVARACRGRARAVSNCRAICTAAGCTPSRGSRRSAGRRVSSSSACLQRQQVAGEIAAVHRGHVARRQRTQRAACRTSCRDGRDGARAAAAWRACSRRRSSMSSRPSQPKSRARLDRQQVQADVGGRRAMRDDRRRDLPGSCPAAGDCRRPSTNVSKKRPDAPRDAQQLERSTRLAARRCGAAPSWACSAHARSAGAPPQQQQRPRAAEAGRVARAARSGARDHDDGRALERPDERPQARSAPAFALRGGRPLEQLAMQT